MGKKKAPIKDPSKKAVRMFSKRNRPAIQTVFPDRYLLNPVVTVVGRDSPLLFGSAPSTPKQKMTIEERCEEQKRVLNQKARYHRAKKDAHKKNRHKLFGKNFFGSLSDDDDDSDSESSFGCRPPNDRRGPDGSGGAGGCAQSVLGL